jgi:hypothetical protein
MGKNVKKLRKIEFEGLKNMAKCAKIKIRGGF